MPNETAIGIDLGTTFSCAYGIKNKECKPIPYMQGQNIVPSVVLFKDSLIHVGNPALNPQDPKNLIRSVKRIMGRSSKEVGDKVAFDVYDQQELAVVEVDYCNRRQRFRPEEISAMILSELKSRAELFLDTKVTECVVTVPAAYDEGQRLATRNAVKIAGMRCLSIINEPTAAALAYICQKKIQPRKTFLIFDIGGGTCDVTIAKVDCNIIQVIATHGDSHLGGDDFDDILVKHFIAELKRKGIDNIEGNHRLILKLRNLCRKMKHALSELNDIDDICDFANSTPLKLTRVRFNQLCEPLYARIKSLLTVAKSNAGKQANIEFDNISNIVLVGGSARIPKIEDILKAAYPTAQIMKDNNLDEIVAMGAVIYASKLSENITDLSNDIAILDITPMSLGVEVFGGRMEKLILKNASIPVEHRKVFSTAKDNATSVRIRVFQGENEKTSENIFLGDFVLEGIPAAEKGKAKIDVIFSLSRDFILHVTAFEESKQKNKKQYEVQALARGLRNIEISQMKQAHEERCEYSKQENVRQNRKNEVLEMCTNLLKAKADDKHVSERCSEILVWIEEKPNANAQKYEKLLSELSKL